MIGGLLSGRFGRLPALLVVLAIGGYFAYTKITDKSDDPASFKATLAEVRSDFGDDAKLVGVANADDFGTIEWDVLAPAGKVTERVYRVEAETEEVGRTGHPESVEKLKRHESEVQRAATGADRKRAVLALGELEPLALERLCKSTGISDYSATFKLTGRKWTYGDGTTDGSHLFSANLDGTGVKRLRTGVAPIIPVGCY